MTGPADYPRDMVGYGPNPPHPQWPGGANIAVQFVLNYEEGAENNVLHGDQASETFLSEIVGAQPFPNRHMSMESLYEYGSRAGLWRVLRVFGRRGLPLTIFGVAMALARNPRGRRGVRRARRRDRLPRLALGRATNSSSPRSSARTSPRRCALMTELTGEAPLGWYTGRDSPQTRALVVEHGGFLYDSDSYADDLPYWTAVDGTRPPGGALHAGHQRHAVRDALADSEAATSSSHYLRDAFDVLYAEGAAGAPKMLSIGLHCRLVGRPARIAALERFLDHVQAHDKVWIARRIDIARHWIAHFPPG